MRSPGTASRTILLVAVSGLAILVSACSSAGAASPKPSAAPPSAAAPASAAGSAATSGEAYTVAVANGTVGAFLTGEDGKTLYTFTPDSANTSTCTGGCATTWPPFTVTAADTLKAGDGVTGKLTTFARPDGTMQVAYDGKPLYYYAKDTAAGDTNGQGVGGKWFVATPTGAAASPSGSGGKGPGY